MRRARSSNAGTHLSKRRCTLHTVFYFALWVRPAEGKEFPRNDPVEVSVLCPLVVLVFLHVKVREVEPAVLQGLAQRCVECVWLSPWQ